MPNSIELPPRGNISTTTYEFQHSRKIATMFEFLNCIVCQPQVSNCKGIAALQVVVMKQCLSVNENGFPGIICFTKRKFVKIIRALKVSGGRDFLKKELLKETKSSLNGSVNWDLT